MTAMPGAARVPQHRVLNPVAPVSSCFFLVQSLADGEWPRGSPAVSADGGPGVLTLSLSQHLPGPEMVAPASLDHSLNQKKKKKCC